MSTIFSFTTCSIANNFTIESFHRFWLSTHFHYFNIICRDYSCACLTKSRHCINVLLLFLDFVVIFEWREQFVWRRKVLLFLLKLKQNCFVEDKARLEFIIIFLRLYFLCFFSLFYCRLYTKKAGAKELFI